MGKPMKRKLSVEDGLIKGIEGACEFERGNKKLKTHKRSTKPARINGAELLSHDPSAIFKDAKVVKKALLETFMDGDREAFVDILSGYVRGQGILKVCQRTKLSRAVLAEAISDDGNPTLDTLCRVMILFKDAASRGV
jgi:DNA-binding phage protein